MSIHVETWRGKGAFIERFEQSKLTLQHITSVLQDRWSAEEQYQKRLERIAGKSSGVTEDGTLGSAWDAFQAFYTFEEQQRYQFQKILLNDVIMPLMDLKKDQQNTKNTLTNEISKLERGIQRRKIEMNKSKHKYLHLQQELEACKSDIGSSKSKDPTKLKLKIASLESEVQATNKQYIHNVDEYNHFKVNLYQEGMKKILNNCADMDAKRVLLTKDLLLHFVEYQQSMYKKLLELCDNLKNSVDNIDERYDVKLFLEESLRKSDHEQKNINIEPTTPIDTKDKLSPSLRIGSHIKIRPKMFRGFLSGDTNTEATSINPDASDRSNDSQDNSLDVSMSEEAVSLGDLSSLHINSGKEAVAIFNYTAKDPTEISFVKGNTIENVLTRVEADEFGVFVPPGWCQGEVNGKTGFFPANFVEVSCLDQNYKVVVEYDFESANEDELQLKVGDEIKVLATAEDGWFRGKAEDGKIGLFPVSHVRLKQ